MRRQRENENQTQEEFEDESLLPPQARKNNNKKSFANQWMTSTFVPSKIITTAASASPAAATIISDKNKVASWTQLANAMQPQKPTTSTDQQQQQETHLHTGLAYHSDCANHAPRRHPFAGEFEIPERTTFTMIHIQECGLDKLCAPIPVVEATYDQLVRVHDPNHI